MRTEEEFIELFGVSGISAEASMILTVYDEAKDDITKLNKIIAELESKRCDLYTTNGLPCKHMNELQEENTRLRKLLEKYYDEDRTRFHGVTADTEMEVRIELGMEDDRYSSVSERRSEQTNVKENENE